jgi:hypothetical protein
MRKKIYLFAFLINVLTGSTVMADINSLRSMALQEQKSQENDRPLLRNREWKDLFGLKANFNQKPTHCETGGLDQPVSKVMILDTPGLLRIVHYAKPKDQGSIVVKSSGRNWMGPGYYWDYSGVWMTGVPHNDDKTEGMTVWVFQIKQGSSEPIEIGIAPRHDVSAGACGGIQIAGFDQMEISFAPDRPVVNESIGYKLYFDGKLVSGSDADHYTLQQAQENCGWNVKSKPNIKIRCVYNNVIFYE